MRIDEALAGVAMLAHSSAAAEITGVQYDSRRVKAGDLFVAMRGGSTDGNRFIEAAIERGAGAIVTDSPEAYAAGVALTQSVPFYLVAHGRRALAEIAANFYGHPERGLKVSAVTGTNGKTTTAFLLEQMLRSVGRKCCLIGTIETRIGDKVRPSDHTTPEASDLFALFADAVAAGCTEVVMEMSSHALDQERVWGVPVDVAIFTNLTQDHLDYHGTMEAYAAAKAKLFAGVGAPRPETVVINADDSFGKSLLGWMSGSRVMSYGIDAGEYRATELKLVAGRTNFTLHLPDQVVAHESTLTGRVNVYNLLAASCAALARGLSYEEVVEATFDLDQVPGRFQVVNGSFGAGFAVVVDYAHTDDALRNLLILGRDLVGDGRVITVFGCGGDRDKTKRPKMGRVAGEGSDVVFITSDNPRSEAPNAIIEEILVGTKPTNVLYLVEPDREKAIYDAIASGKEGDIVLIAGKGHEKTQIFHDRTVAFDDVEIAFDALRPVLAAVKTRVALQKLKDSK
jgi:UDP-N-acetylmuramoyl-L-alanyl-D-glutamate--2,6-diaminopimelate ligase